MAKLRYRSNAAVTRPQHHPYQFSTCRAILHIAQICTDMHTAYVGTRGDILGWRDVLQARVL
jgi:hypothetical protein